ncbi:unnamed protein product [Prorocentrum cordatum]|uniref:Diacylglycerol kinase n=1 Tax=Prorocentrum cordatum TaxID=2364126 RepID=A0ABN9S379_9DINO|nr:unnamed protein product [Polarella glacialis]
MEAEFKRLLAGPRRELDIGIGMVCHLGTGGVADSLRKVAELQRVNVDARERRIHLLVCGGDGTVTWVLSEIEAFMQAHPDVLRHQPPIGVVPMGTGNDLARSLGWDSKFRDSAHVARYVHNALEGTVVELDQWKVTLRPKSLLPPALHSVHGLEHVAYFQNYFSVGMDAQITHGVHLARRDSCGRCCFRAGIGKVCYVVHAPCRCCCCASPTLDLQVNYVPADSHNSAALPMVLGEARQFTMSNINSYGAGRVLFSSEDLERVRPNDGLLEVFTVADPLALGLLSNPLVARSTPFQQARRVEMTLGGGQFFQLDGEPFFVDAECRVTVEHHRKVRLLCPPEGRAGQHAAGGVWRGRQKRAFWRDAAPLVLTPGATPQPRRAAGAQA